MSSSPDFEARFKRALDDEQLAELLSEPDGGDWDSLYTPLVEGLIPMYGLSILVGPPNTTTRFATFGVELALSVATGDPALGTIPVKQGTVLVVGVNALIVSEALGDRPKPPTLDRATKWPPLGQLRRLADEAGLPPPKAEGVKALETWSERRLEAAYRARLAFFSGRAVHGARSRSNLAADQAELQALHDFSHAYGVAVLVGYTHSEATPGRRAMADRLLELEHGQGASDAILRIADPVDTRELALRHDGSWRLVGEAGAATANASYAAVLDGLRAAPQPLTARELAVALGTSFESTRKRLQRMQRQGLVRREASGWCVCA